MKEKVQINMSIDYSLYMKSKSIIQNRTKDYEDYLKRRIAANGRLDMLQKERDEIKARLDHLDIEIDHELQIKDGLKELEKDAEEIISDAVFTILRIVENEGVIGLDRIEEIAAVKDISFGELKAAVVNEIDDTCKVVNFHPQVRERKGSLTGNVV